MQSLRRHLTLTIYKLQEHVSTIQQSDGFTWISQEDKTYPQECLVPSDEYRCWQKFVISTTFDECSSGQGSSYTFETTFDLLSILDCSDSNDLSDQNSACSQYINNNGNNADIGQLTLDYTVTCDENVYTQDLSVQATENNSN